jgi:hypothetical protein
MSDLTNLETLIGGSLSQTFGDIGVAIIALLFFISVGIAMRAGFEVMVVVLVGVVVLLAMLGIIPQIIVMLILILASLIILVALSKWFIK